MPRFSVQELEIVSDILTILKQDGAEPTPMGKRQEINAIQPRTSGDTAGAEQYGWEIELFAHVIKQAVEDYEKGKRNKILNEFMRIWDIGELRLAMRKRFKMKELKERRRAKKNYSIFIDYIKEL